MHNQEDQRDTSTWSKTIGRGRPRIFGAVSTAKCGRGCEADFEHRARVAE